MDHQSQICLSVCTRCKPPGFSGPDHRRPGYLLAEAVLRALRQTPAYRLVLRGVRCMSQCKRPCVLALSAPGKYTLLFGDLDPQTIAPEAAAPAILTLADQYAVSADGYVPRDRRPAPLRSGILGRIPPLGHTGDAIDETFAFPPNSFDQKETL
ncbi:MAG: DUF1636 domain-containing protein [Pseudomonadota bacterium]